MQNIFSWIVSELFIFFSSFIIIYFFRFWDKTRTCNSSNESACKNTTWLVVCLNKLLNVKRGRRSVPSMPCSVFRWRPAGSIQLKINSRPADPQQSDKQELHTVTWPAQPFTQTHRPTEEEENEEGAHAEEKATARQPW